MRRFVPFWHDIRHSSRGTSPAIPGGILRREEAESGAEKRACNTASVASDPRAWQLVASPGSKEMVRRLLPRLL